MRLDTNGNTQTIFISPNSLLFHPPEELRRHFTKLMFAATHTTPDPEPDAGDLLQHAAQRLRAEGWLQLTPRGAEGRIWLPPQLEPYRAELTADERPVLRLKPVRVSSGEPPAPWNSKLRGAPYRPRGAAWPLDGYGKPMNFLAQFNLSELNADGVLPDFPREGLLQFFVSPTQPDTAQVMYYPQVKTDAAQLDTSTPNETSDAWLVAEMAAGDFDVYDQWRWEVVADTEATNAMQLHAQGFEKRHPEIDSKTWEAYVNGELNAQGGSRLGGHAQLMEHSNFIQPNERTLFQLDMDNLFFGGWLGFFIAQEDLAAQRFERAELVPDAF